MNEMNIAWASGLFEGEGSIGFRKVSTGRAPTSVRLGMTDQDCVEAFRDVMQCGNIRIEERPDPHKDLWYWEVSGFDDIYHVLGLMAPWLKSRRSAALNEAIAYIDKRKREGRTVNHLGGRCQRGHLLTETTLTGNNRCRICLNNAKIAYKERHSRSNLTNAA